MKTETKLQFIFLEMVMCFHSNQNLFPHPRCLNHPAAPIPISRACVVSRPFPIVLVKCWKVTHWIAKKLLPKFPKLSPKFLDIFLKTLIKSFIFRSSQ